MHKKSIKNTVLNNCKSLLTNGFDKNQETILDLLHFIDFNG
jgi:hypothetical protein